MKRVVGERQEKNGRRREIWTLKSGDDVSGMLGPFI
jgi:hypothetical protein